MSPRASGIVRGASLAVATPARTATARMTEDQGLTSGELDVGGPLVLAARGVGEGHHHLAGIGHLEGKGKERVLAHTLRGVEGGDGLSRVRRHHLGAVVVLLLDDLARAVALDALHGMDDERAHADDVARLDGGGHAKPDLADVGHDVAPYPPQPPTVTLTSRFTCSRVPSLCSTMARTS